MENRSSHLTSHAALARVSLDSTLWAGQPLTSAFPDALLHFLLFQTSVHTRSAYARDIIEFLRFSEEKQFQVKTLSDVSEKIVLHWKDHLLEKHARFDNSKRRVASASVARKLCALSSLMDFALKRKLIAENPLAHIMRPRVRRQSHATVLNEQELQEMLAASRAWLSHVEIASFPNERKRKTALLKAEMEWCILVLLFSVGLRVSELCQLKLSDISREDDLLRLHLLAKGGRNHSPLIHPETAQTLIRYIERVHSGSSGEAPLFPAGRPSAFIHRSTVFRMVRDAAKRAGITRSFSPHGCRATLATQLHLNNVPVVEIQSLLNHAQVTTTQLYLHRVDESKEAAALRLPWAHINKLKPSNRS
ncbi:MAG: hypothetical protein RIR26_336 [Pseudomonadota bacterium]|jgi:integrase/recombinase XerD